MKVLLEKIEETEESPTKAAERFRYMIKQPDAIASRV